MNLDKYAIQPSLIEIRSAFADALGTSSLIRVVEEDDRHSQVINFAVRISGVAPRTRTYLFASCKLSAFKHSVPQSGTLRELPWFCLSTVLSQTAELYAIDDTQLDISDHCTLDRFNVRPTTSDMRTGKNEFVLANNVGPNMHPFLNPHIARRMRILVDKEAGSFRQGGTLYDILICGRCKIILQPIQQ